MPGNSFGQSFRISTFGESHGPALGVIIDGCPPGIAFDQERLERDMARRRPGQSAIVTQRKEGDAVEVLSGVFQGRTTGTPLALLIRNTDQRSKDYGHIAEAYRPSHADFTYQIKYGIRDFRGGGRSSARETAARVAAGSVASMFLEAQGVFCRAWVSQVGHLQLNKPYAALDLSLTESNPVRCPDPDMAAQMEALIREVRKDGDTVGGVISAVCTGVPPGLGEPVFDKLHADLAKAMMSINATRGFEYGSGFAGAPLRGSQHNDAYVVEDGRISTATNRSGGVQGGISNGMDIDFRVAFKPVATIIPPQESVDRHGDAVTVEGKGRHDPCVLPRAVAIVEAMAALVLADHWLRYRGQGHFQDPEAAQQDAPGIRDFPHP
ncbi:MAG: chorismate synthase [Bacteroidetes bacterium]|nr:chorismate synthase [Bacteroidota bacterium]